MHSFNLSYCSLNIIWVNLNIILINWGSLAKTVADAERAYRHRKRHNKGSQQKLANQDEKADEAIDEEQEVGLDRPLLLLQCQVII